MLMMDHSSAILGVLLRHVRFAQASGHSEPHRCRLRGLCVPRQVKENSNDLVDDSSRVAASDPGPLRNAFSCVSVRQLWCCEPALWTEGRCSGVHSSHFSTQKVFISPCPQSWVRMRC
eukprot:2710761-Rhodomonas_salina.2